MRKAHWEKNIFELIRRTSVDLPTDVENAIKRARRREKKGSRAHDALNAMLVRAKAARDNDQPLCEQAGTLAFYFSVPVGCDTNALVARTRAAVSRATRAGYLGENTVDSVTGALYANNIAHGAPVIHFQQGARKTFDVRLVMTGAGAENMSRQFALPSAALKAERNLDGVRRCILDSVEQARNGCSPVILGVSIGGDRSAGFAHARQQFLHKVGHRSRLKVLSRLEERVMRESRKPAAAARSGGKSCLLGINIGSLSRLPGCFFVSVACMDWAFRRRGALMGPEGGVHRWLY